MAAAAIWIFRKWNLTSAEVAAGQYIPPHQIWWRYIKGRPSYGSLCVVKTGADITEAHRLKLRSANSAMAVKKSQFSDCGTLAKSCISTRVRTRGSQKRWSDCGPDPQSGVIPKQLHRTLLNTNVMQNNTLTVTVYMRYQVPLLHTLIYTKKLPALNRHACFDSCTALVNGSDNDVLLNAAVQKFSRRSRKIFQRC